MMSSQLIAALLFAMLGWFLMWADYGLTLVVARSAQAAGLRYELNPFLRADVAARRWLSPRFVLGTITVLLALLAISLLATDGTGTFVRSAVLAGLITTRLHLIGLHIRNWWRHAQGRPSTVPTTRQAMLSIANQQTTLAVLFTLVAVLDLAPRFQAVWVGAAGGFLLMASTTLLWRWRERQPLPRPHRARTLPWR